MNCPVCSKEARTKIYKCVSCGICPRSLLEKAPANGSSGANAFVGKEKVTGDFR